MENIKITNLTIISIILTMIITQIIKIIYVKKGIITKTMDDSQKDQILTTTGRISLIITYTLSYILKTIILKQELYIDETFIVSITAEISIALIICKGIYSFLHQYQKKKTIYEKLNYVEETINKTWTLTKEGEK